MKMKKRLKLSAMTVFFAMLLGFAVMSIGTEQAFAMEWNETDNRYEISNYNDLKEFANIVNGTNGVTQNTAACAKLTTDIECTDEILDNTDILVDGRFVEELKSIALVFRGSENQRIIDMKQTREQGRVVLSSLMNKRPR